MDRSNWDLYRSLLAVLDTGSLTGAARQLGLTQPTIGRHIEALEMEAGQPLFTRSQRGLEPTDTALSIQHLARAMAASADAIRRTASESRTEIAGNVRISTSDVIAVEVLPDILAPLMNDYTRLVIEVSVSDSVEDLLNRQADIAIRLVRPKQDALLVRHIGTIPIGCFARKDVIERHGSPQKLEDLKGLPLIGYDEEREYIREATKAFGDFQLPGFTFRTDSNLAQLAAIRSGCGFGFCQRPLGLRDPRLIEVVTGQVPLSLPLWVVMHEDLRRSPRCRAAFDAMAKGLKSYINSAYDPPDGR